VASNWKGLKDSIEAWHDQRVQAVEKVQKEAAEQLRDDIQGEILKRPSSDRRNMANKTKENPIGGLSTYAESVIIDEDGDGTDKVISVRIKDPSKKDGTTGMEIGKIAKAIEFGSSKNSPRPAWRRSLAKMRVKGVFKSS
jgi:hypothetical protein